MSKLDMKVTNVECQWPGTIGISIFDSVTLKISSMQRLYAVRRGQLILRPCLPHSPNPFTSAVDRKDAGSWGPGGRCGGAQLAGTGRFPHSSLATLSIWAKTAAKDGNQAVWSRAEEAWLQVSRARAASRPCPAPADVPLPDCWASALLNVIRDTYYDKNVCMNISTLWSKFPMIFLPQIFYQQYVQSR